MSTFLGNYFQMFIFCRHILQLIRFKVKHTYLYVKLQDQCLRNTISPKLITYHVFRQVCAVIRYPNRSPCIIEVNSIKFKKFH